MTFFESLVALLLMAIVLLQVSRRTWIPYPTMLAAAGVVVALIPGSPTIVLDGHTALALFIAPILLDAAFDFPLAAIKTLWRQLLSLAVGAVIVTTGVVAWIGWQFAGLPIAAALTLGAIVAPPDAAAATSILRSTSLPRRTTEVLTGESLLNDASALLLFSAVVAIQGSGIDTGVAVRLGLAVPGGIALGFAFAWVNTRIQPFVRGSLGGNLLEFVNCFVAWLVAERLGLSAVLCVVTMAMVIANSVGRELPARSRIHSFAVWSTVVFLLNVLAFLLMGMQIRAIIGGMSAERLHDAARIAALVVVAVVLTRMAWVVLFNRLAARFAAVRGDVAPVGITQGLVVGWCGMRGLVTLATAFALPASFPQRDLIMLTAFAVVFATLVLQGLTLTPLIRLLGVQDDGGEARELDKARVALADVALRSVKGAQGGVADELRRQFEINRREAGARHGDAGFRERQELKRHVIAQQREQLRDLRDDGTIGAASFETLQEELDWSELAVGPEDERVIEES